MNQATVAAAVTSMVLTDGRPTEMGSMTIANEAVRVAFALSDGRDYTAHTIAKGIGLEIEIAENDDVFVCGKTREWKLIEGHEWRAICAARDARIAQLTGKVA